MGVEVCGRCRFRTCGLCRVKAARAFTTPQIRAQKPPLTGQDACRYLPLFRIVSLRRADFSRTWAEQTTRSVAAGDPAGRSASIDRSANIRLASDDRLGGRLRPAPLGPLPRVSSSRRRGRPISLGSRMAERRQAIVCEPADVDGRHVSGRDNRSPKAFKRVLLAATSS